MELTTEADQNGGMAIETIVRRRISLDDIRPEIWRVMQILTPTSLIERWVRTMTYAYDIGDDWRQIVTIRAFETGDAKVNYPRFVAGQRCCRPEDVRRWPGLDNFIDVIADRADPENLEMVPWHDGGLYNPEDMAELAAKGRIGVIICRREDRSSQKEIFSLGAG